jgi:long-chain acyl-CoA synthetase
VGDLRRELATLSTAPPGAARIENLPSLRPTSERSPLDRALLRCTLASISALYKRYFNLRQADVEGTLPAEGPYILAANHSSHLDVGAIMAAVTARRGRAEAERLHVLGARDYFFNKPLKSWFFSRFFNVVPIRRDQTGLDGLRTAKAILARGEPVLIFPEATRSRSGKMQLFKPGLGLLAYEANVPVIPACIQGTYAALPAGKVVPKALPLKIKFGAPLCMEDYRRSGATVARDELYRRISQDVRERIEKLAAGA